MSKSRDEYVAQAFYEALDKFADTYMVRTERKTPWSELRDAEREWVTRAVHELAAAGVVEHGPLTRQQVSVLGAPTELEARLRDAAREV